MARNPLTTYTADLTERLWRYRQAVHGGQDALFEPKYAGSPSPPVFKQEHADRNVLVPDDPARAAVVRGLVPRGKQHKWYRSMKSSQALVLSVFGNLKVLKRVACLSSVFADDGAGPAFRRDPIDAEQVELEHNVNTLHEPRSTSIDVLISGPTVVCAECKLSESEVGRCSRPRLKLDHPEHCDGSYRRQARRKHRCALAERGIAYWDYIPSILKGAEWQADADHDPCPLARPYQLVRNVLSACVQDGKVNKARGHALLVYDARNPAFHPQKGNAFEVLRDQLVEPSVLRRCSWQAILKVMAGYDDLKWLGRALEKKYGLRPED